MRATIAVRNHVSAEGLRARHGPELPEEVSQINIRRPEKSVVHCLRRAIKIKHIKEVCGREIDNLIAAELAEKLARRLEDVVGGQRHYQIVAFGLHCERII